MITRPELGLTFDGFIHEFEGIRVDNFTTTRRPTRFFLLTHAHADHLKGLESGGFSGHTIYCSEITRELIKQNPNFSRNLTSMKALEENERHRIEYNGGFIYLTLIPARHCPGAVMFLIENDVTSVLITGDIRAESDWVDSLARNHILFDYTTSNKQLDNLYLDTTYGYRGEPFIEMKSNSFGLQSLMELMKLYPDTNDISYYFADSTIGYEEVWIQMVKNDKMMHVSPALNKRLRMLSEQKDFEYSKNIHKISSSSPHSKFHCCGVRPQNCSGPISKFPVRIKHCIDINIKDLMKLTLPLSFEQYKNEAVFVEELPSGHKIYTIDEQAYLLPNGTDHLLRNELRFFFSRHSSYEECRHFVSMFNVKQVFPLTESAITWEQGFQMKRQFGDLCTSNEFLYDSSFANVYGPAPTGLKSPFIVNKWSESLFLRSWNNENNVKRTTISGEFNFVGQQAVRNQAFRDDLDVEERQILKEHQSLYNKNRVLCGVSQYRVENMIKSCGYHSLKKYKKDDNGDDDDDLLQDTFGYNESQESDSMSQAAYKANQLRIREPKKVYSDVSIENTRAEGGILFTPSVIIDVDTQMLDMPKVLKSQDTNKCINTTPNSPLKQLKPPFIPHLQPLRPSSFIPVIDVEEIESEVERSTPRISFLRKRLALSPMSPRKQQKKTKIDYINVQKIAEAVFNDENFGFFQYKLKSCSESPKRVD